MKIEELPVKPPPSMERVMPFAPFPVASLVGATPTSASSQMLLSAGSPSQSASGCCESGRPIFTDPSTGQTICSCQYVSSMGLLGGAASRVPGSVGDSLLASAYAAHGYLPLGGDPSTLCATLGSPYDLKDAPEALRTLAHSSAYYTYDPALATYPYSYGALDLNSAARRKNATRENTNTLKAWLYEHRKNPYPTKGEKIMLAIITKMTLTQVSTWFANARRRLKKENKMTWSPRPGIKDDEDDDGEDGDVKDKVSEDHDLDPNHSISMEDSDDEDIIVDEGREDHHHQSAALLLARIPHPLVPGHAVSMATSTSTCSHSNPASPNNDAPASPTTSTENEESASEQTLNDPPPPTGLRLNNNDEKAHDIESDKIDKTSSEGRPSPVPDDSKKKPKIWSLADVATSGSSSHTEKSRSPFTLSHPPGNFPHPIYAQSQLHPRFPPHYQNGLRPWINGYPLPGAFLVGPPAFPGPEMLPVSLAPSLVAPRTMDMTSQLNGAGSYPVALLTTSTVSRPSETHTLASKSPETPPKPRSIHGGPPPTAHVHHISRMELASRTSPTGSHGNGSSGSHVTSIAGPKVIRPLPLTQKIIPGVKH